MSRAAHFGRTFEDGVVGYFRALGDPEEDNEFDIDLADFDFWSASVGVTLRW